MAESINLSASDCKCISVYPHDRPAATFALALLVLGHMLKCVSF